MTTTNSNREVGPIGAEVDEFLAPTRQRDEYRRLVVSSAECTACELYRDATQVVFGRGPVPARIRFERSGKVRIHKKPGAAHVRACRPWWEAELEVVAPDVLVCLGAVAAQAVFGSGFRVTRDRGILLPFDGHDVDVVATIHPSAVLRARDDGRDQAYEGLVADLRVAADRLG